MRAILAARPFASLSVPGRHARVLANVGWLSLGQAARLLVSFAAGIFVARFLGPPQFGLLRFSLAVAEIFGQIVRKGIHSVLVKDMVREPERTGVILGSALAIRLVLAAIAFPASIGLVLLLGTGGDGVVLFVALLALGNSFNALVVVEAWFEARTLSRPFVLAGIAANVAVAALKLVLVWWQAPLVGFVAVSALEFVLNAAASVAAYLHSGGRPGEWRVRLGVARDLFRRSAPLLASGIIVILYMRLDEIMLRQLASDRDVGIYAAGARLSEIIYLLPGAVVASVFPSLVRARTASAALYGERMQLGYDVLAMAAFALAVPISLVATPLIGLLYGDAFRPAAAVLVVHIWTTVFVFMRALFVRWTILEEAYRLMPLQGIASIVVKVGLNLWLIPAYGPVGAAIATLATYALTAYLLLFLLPSTRPTAARMSLALLSPFRLRAIVARLRVV